jgi:phage baseplate assembly protein W
MYNLDFPYHFDGRGRTAGTELDDHIRDLIEQVLFIAPGERVNRPTFGSGLMQAVFAPNSQEMAAATQFLVQGALQQNLSELIEVNKVEVSADDNILNVTIEYVVRNTQQQQVAQFTRGGLSQ